MGYISNQWLNTGKGSRQRSYDPVNVEISFDSPADRWSKEHGIFGRIKCWKSGGQYQTIYLSEVENETLVEMAVSVLSAKAKEKLVASLLQELSQSKLLRTLALDLRKRVRLPKDKKDK